jgi:hypothetical protein
VSFKQGKFYAIQCVDRDGEVLFVEASGRSGDHAERLKAIARKAGRFNAKTYNLMDDEDDDDFDYKPVRVNQNPFALRTFSIDSEPKLIIDHMRQIRKNCGNQGIDPNSLKIVIVETSVSTYVPESPSDEETELRRYVLEKLSPEEQKLLRVEHWAVYNKLADRSMLPDDEEQG